MLDLKGTKVTDAGEKKLRQMLPNCKTYRASELVWLNLRGTKVTDEGVKKLQQALPKCKIDPSSNPAEKNSSSTIPSQGKTAESAATGPAPAFLKANEQSGETSAARPASEGSPTSDQSAAKEGSTPDQPVKIVQQATINSYKGLVSGKGSGTYRLSLKDRPDEKCDFEIVFDSDKFNFLTTSETHSDCRIAVSDGSATIVRTFVTSLGHASRTAYILRPGAADLLSATRGLPSLDLPECARSSFGPKGFETHSIKVVKLPDGRLRGTYDINKFVEGVIEATPDSGFNVSRVEGFNKSGGRTGSIFTAEWKRDGNVWYVAARTREDFRDGVVQQRSELRYKEFTANPRLSPELFTLQQLNLPPGSTMIDLRPGPSKTYYYVDPKDIANKPQKISEQVESMTRRL
jgi:hypothetical protein